MRVFLSYRRDDTAGRAGRLGDGLTSRLGASNVFQDVGSIAPGVDFERAVLDALAETDATIVVIGPEWATLRGPNGRRLDQPGDYVRWEVSAALKSGGPVVPVLVGDARMPEPDDLPEELRPLLKRQAIEVRDATWHGDIDGLVSRLRAEVDPVNRRRLVGAVAAGVVIILAGASALWWRDGDAVTSDENSTSGTADAADAADPTTPCSAAEGSSWSTISLAAEPTGTLVLADGSDRQVGYTATGVRAKYDQPTWRVLVDVQVSNDSTAIAESWYVDYRDFRRLVTDGVAGTLPVCFSVLSGAQNLPPGQRSIVRVGFDSPTDPRQAELILETNGPPIPLAPGGA